MRTNFVVFLYDDKSCLVTLFIYINIYHVAITMAVVFLVGRHKFKGFRLGSLLLFFVSTQYLLIVQRFNSKLRKKKKLV